MVGRVKFQVWGKHGWVTAYVKSELLSHNIYAFVKYGFTVCAKGLTYTWNDGLEAA